MGHSRRIAVVATSIFLFLLLAISLATSLKLEARVPPPKLIKISLAQAQRMEQADRDLMKGKAKINGSDFDRASIFPAPTVYLTAEATPARIPTMTTTVPFGQAPTSSIDEGDGMIGLSKTSQPSPTGDDPASIPATSAAIEPVSPTSALPSNQLPILALTYTGASGPKHCRGDLIQKLSLAPPGTAHKNGTCVSLPSMARCGVFFADKEAGCQADLFESEGCENTTMSYVNTVVFLPEERSVGAYWKSMWVKCGVEAPEAKLLDPGLLGGLVKGQKKGGG
jgi:hypothetical protein